MVGWVGATVSFVGFLENLIFATGCVKPDRGEKSEKPALIALISTFAFLLMLPPSVILITH